MPLQFCMICAVGAVVSAYLCIFIHGFYVDIVLLWLVLVFGGAIVPGATGIWLQKRRGMGDLLDCVGVLFQSGSVFAERCLEVGQSAKQTTRFASLNNIGE